MTSEKRTLGVLPIIIGVTGHRDLRAQDSVDLETAVGQIFDKFRIEYPTTPLLALTPLAKGADRLVARVAIGRSIPYLVPLPMPVEQYITDFSQAEQSEFAEFYRSALGSYTMPFFNDNSPSNLDDPKRRADQYALVGAHIARSSHVLIALWNGMRSAAPEGTALVVRFRCYGVPRSYGIPGSNLDRPSVLDAPETGAVYHVVAPRVDEAAPISPGHTQRLVRGGTPTHDDPYPVAPLAEGKEDPFEPLFSRIKDFNDDALLVGVSANSGTSYTERLLSAAEAAATYYQAKSSRALNRLFIATGCAALILAIYSHLIQTAHVLVVPYTVALTTAIVVYARARRGRWQDRSQDYRALEIGLKVQHVWDRVGLKVSVADYYIRRQRTELDWIREAIRTAHNVDRTDNFDQSDGVAAVRQFIVEQLAYFERSSRRDREANHRYETIANWSLRASFASSALLLSFALAMLWRLVANIPPPIGIAELSHGVLIFLITGFTILAALLHDYPQRRALHQQARRYAVMHDIYKRAKEALDSAEHPTRSPIDDRPLPLLVVAREVILDIGREALTENGDWVLLHRELPIELLSV